MLGEDSLTKREVFEVNKASHVYEFQEYKISEMGAMILNIPRPTPAAVSVLGIQNLGLSRGDVVLAARNNSNNPAYSLKPLNQPRPGQDPGSLVPGVHFVKVEEIKDYVVGVVDRVEGNRIIMKLHFQTKYREVGWPKPSGAIVRVVGYNNNYADGRAEERNAKKRAEDERNHKNKYTQGTNYGS